jgi:hypothetical protein
MSLHKESVSPEAESRILEAVKGIRYGKDGKLFYAAGIFNGVPDGASMGSELDANNSKDLAGPHRAAAVQISRRSRRVERLRVSSWRLQWSAIRRPALL